MPQILLVEDNYHLLQELALNLMFADYQVVTAEDGQAALELLETGMAHPDIIISDIGMPRMDGYRLYDAVRARSQWVGIPFIFLTARDGEADLEHGYGLGVDDYLVKPFDTDHLLRVIRSKLKRSQMLKADLQAREANLEQAKKQLAQMVAHELRTPLASITMVSEVLSRHIAQMSPPQAQELLDIMGRGSQRLARLIDQMVLFFYLESGALGRASVQQLEATMPLWDILTGAIGMARRFAYRNTEIMIRFKDHDRETTVLCDTRSLEHAFAELISNAMNFSPTGGEVVIQQWQTQGQVWVSITDAGPGMTPEETALALEPFQQIGRDVNEQQGVGIGLTLAQRIVKAHEGILEMKSVKGKGTQVHVGLPAH